MSKIRNYQAEYARRIANAAARGLSRSQARGHARTGEAQIKGPKSKTDDRLEAALKVLRQTGNRTSAAKAFNIAPERLRRFLREDVQIEGRGRSLRIIDNRPRDWKVISNGQVREIRLRDFNETSLNGQHLAAFGKFVRTNDRELLLPFEGRVVIDAKGKSHPLETDPNELHRIASLGSEVFHEIYKLVSIGG